MFVFAFLHVMSQISLGHADLAKGALVVCYDDSWALESSVSNQTSLARVPHVALRALHCLEAS